jgi:hypothetical protein
MRRLQAQTITIIAAIGLLAAGPTAAQNPQNIPSGSSQWVSRFIPEDLLLRMQERPRDVADAIVLSASADSVWAALRATLDALGVPIGFDDRAAGEIGHPQAKLFRRLGKQRLSSYVRCGSGLTGPNADTYQVFLSFVTFMKPLGDGRVAVAPFLTGHAIDVAGARSDAVACTTTGRLEATIAEQLRERLGQPSF